MQLILALAALLLLGGSGGSPRPEMSSSDMLEVLKYVSGNDGETDKIIKEVEQVSKVISTLAPLVTAFGANNNGINEPDGVSVPAKCDIGLSLQPIANIADDSIYNALSKAMA